MSREIKVSKYKGNTHYTVQVVDSYGQEHNLGYYERLDYIETGLIEREAERIWSNEVEPKEDLLGKAILNCKELDSKNPNLKDIL